VSKTLKPIIHHRDHERGGADVVLIAWEDCDTSSPEPPPITGGWKNAVVNITWTSGTWPVTDPPSKLGGTFHDGTVPGVWTRGTGDSSFQTAYHGTWLVAFSGTISRDPASVSTVTEVWFEHDFDTASQVALYNDTLNPGDSVPISYSVILTDVLNVALPVKAPHFGTVTSTLAGTMTFTWQ